MSASARLAANSKTAHAFPARGIQHKMAWRCAPAPRRPAVGHRGQPTRDTASVPHVVRDNPTSIIASGTTTTLTVLYRRFTQVAMATVAAAQVAEMRTGSLRRSDHRAWSARGTALACVTGIYQSNFAGDGVSPRVEDARHRYATSWPCSTWLAAIRCRPRSTSTTCRWRPRSSPGSRRAPVNSRRS